MGIVFCCGDAMNTRAYKHLFHDRVNEKIPAERISGIPRVAVQVMKTGSTPQLATSDRLREAEKKLLHLAGRLHTPEVLQDAALLLLQRY